MTRTSRRLSAVRPGVLPGRTAERSPVTTAAGPEQGRRVEGAAADVTEGACLDQLMTSVDQDGKSGSPRTRSLAVWLGGASVVCWFCCPFWALVWFFALPMGLAGLVRGWVEYRAAVRLRESRKRAVVGSVLSLVGACEATAYLIFLATHPDLPVQG